ncbi:MAG TPA: hypothetical protein VF613_23145 [Longimicrobium sp.]|jgi:hypothetical protein
MLIDRFLPEPEVVSRHETEVNAPGERVWAAARTLDLASSSVVKALFALRSLPGLLSRATRERRLGVDMDGLLRTGFVLLDEAPGDEVVLGLVGRFWTPAGGIVRVAPEDFTAFQRPGYAVAAWNFTVRGPAEGPVRLATETRVRLTDPSSRRRFRAYWTVVGPFSGLIRREMLRTIRRAAETSPHTEPQRHREKR